MQVNEFGAGCAVFAAGRQLPDPVHMGHPCSGREAQEAERIVGSDVTALECCPIITGSAKSLSSARSVNDKSVCIP
jgi:hypothetical protein